VADEAPNQKPPKIPLKNNTPRSLRSRSETISTPLPLSIGWYEWVWLELTRPPLFQPGPPALHPPFLFFCPEKKNVSLALYHKPMRLLDLDLIHYAAFRGDSRHKSGEGVWRRISTPVAFVEILFKLFFLGFSSAKTAETPKQLHQFTLQCLILHQYYTLKTFT
jgi:hypothetical protein